MKKIFITIALSIFSFNAYSENATYDADTKIAHIPVLEMNGNPIMSDVNLYLRADGLLEIVSFKEYAPNNTPDSDGKNYPYKDNITFSDQYVDELFILTDGSMWQITGASDAYSVGRQAKDFTIYSGTDSIPEPRYGDKSDYFMLISGSSTTYFVKPL